MDWKRYSVIILVRYKKVGSLQDIFVIEDIERQYYGSQGYSKDMISQIVHFTGFVYCAVIESEIVGYIIFSKSRDPNYMHCFGLTVVEKYRRQGIGSHLIKLGEKECKKLHIDTVTATAKPQNTPSCKAFINSSRWKAISLSKNLIHNEEHSFTFHKILKNKKVKQERNSMIVPLSDIQKVEFFMGHGFLGKKILEDDKIVLEEMFKQKKR